MTEFRIDIIKRYSPEVFWAVTELMPLLSSYRPTPDEMEAVIDCPCTRLFAAFDGAALIGMLTLVIVQIPSGLRVHIEDVVVAVAYRRRGAAKTLTEAAIGYASKLGARTIDLTSRPQRTVAIRLYEGLGFKRRDTGAFRLELSEQHDER